MGEPLTEFTPINAASRLALRDVFDTAREVGAEHICVNFHVCDDAGQAFAHVELRGYLHRDAPEALGQTLVIPEDISTSAQVDDPEQE